MVPANMHGTYRRRSHNRNELEVPVRAIRGRRSDSSLADDESGDDLVFVSYSMSYLRLERKVHFDVPSVGQHNEWRQ
jgi:hypothetical protein